VHLYRRFSTLQSDQEYSSLFSEKYEKLGLLIEKNMHLSNKPRFIPCVNLFLRKLKAI